MTSFLFTLPLSLDSLFSSSSLNILVPLGIDGDGSRDAGIGADQNSQRSTNPFKSQRQWTGRDGVGQWGEERRFFVVVVVVVVVVIVIVSFL